MHKSYYLGIVIIASILLGGCAATYKSFNASQIPYKELNTENEKISYTARQNVMFNTFNYNYAKREKKGTYNLVAFKIVNKSDIQIAVKDLNYSCGGSTQILPVSMEEYIKENKQKSGLYWLYALGVLPNPFGRGNLYKVIPAGVIPAVVNFGIAHKANKKLKKDIALYDISNKVIQPNDTIYGILPFKGIDNCGEIYITTPY